MPGIATLLLWLLGLATLFILLGVLTIHLPWAAAALVMVIAAVVIGLKIDRKRRRDDPHS